MNCIIDVIFNFLSEETFFIAKRDKSNHYFIFVLLVRIFIVSLSQAKPTSNLFYSGANQTYVYVIDFRLDQKC